MTDGQTRKPSDGDNQPAGGTKSGLEGEEQLRTAKEPSDGDGGNPPTTKTGLDGKE